jgi:hypothetical protein
MKLDARDQPTIAPAETLQADPIKLDAAALATAVPPKAATQSSVRGGFFSNFTGNVMRIIVDACYRWMGSLRIKNKPNPENFTLLIYTVQLDYLPASPIS